MVFDGTVGVDGEVSLDDTEMGILVIIPLSTLVFSLGVSQRGSGGGCNFLKRLV